MIIQAEPRTDGYMNAIQVIDVIRELSHSQGFYSRLYQSIIELRETNEEQFNEWCKETEAMNFKEPVDVVLYFES